MSSSKSAPDFPGYYFDENKNRYFKLPNGESSHKYKKSTKQRNKNFKRKLKLKTSCPKNLIFSLTRQAIYGEQKFYQNLRNIGTKNALKSMKYESTPFHLNVPFIKSIQVSPRGDKVISLSDDNRVCQLTLFQPDSALDHITFQPIYRFQRSGNVIFCFTHLNGHQNSGVLVADLMDGVTLFPNTNFNNRFGVSRKFEHGTPFACAASENQLNNIQLSYSDGKKAVLVSHYGHHFSDFNSPQQRTHPIGGRGSSVLRFHSDIKCQCFSPVDVLHLNGLRNGQLFGNDLRMRLTRNLSNVHIQYKTGISVKDIICMRNGCHVLVNYEGTDAYILKWDLRFAKRPVGDFAHGFEFNNDGNVHSLGWAFDYENILSVYNDSTVRLWNTETLQMFHKHENLNKLTTMMYLKNWELFDGSHGMLCNTENKLSFISSTKLPRNF